MLKITPPALPEKATAYLEKKTRELTELSYEGQVTTAQAAWNSKSVARFCDVRTALEVAGDDTQPGVLSTAAGIF